MVTRSDAQALAAVGLSPLWLSQPVPGDKSSGKMPITKGWTLKHWVEPDAVDKPPRPDSNLGLRTGWVKGAPVRVIVVDGDSQEALDEMARALPPTPLRVRTAKGEHWYYRDTRASAHPAIKNKVRLKGLKADIRGDGGQVVAPGSVHYSGHVYAAVAPITRDMLDSLPAFDTAWVEPLADEPVATPVKGAIAEGQRNASLTSLAGSLRRRGLSEAGILAALQAENTLRCSPPLPDAEVRTIAASIGSKPLPNEAVAAGWDNLLEKRANGALLANVANCVVILANDRRWSGVLAYDDFAQAVVVTDEPPWDASDFKGVWSTSWSDLDDVRLKNWFQRNYKLAVSTGIAGEAARLAAHLHSFDPVKDSLEGLVWDQQSRVDHWLHTYLGAPDTDYTQAVGRWWLISAVARVYQPGCKVDHMLVWQAHQGAGKSSTARILAGDGLFQDTPLDLATKDAYLALAGKWIIEWAELDAMTRAEASRVKAFVSSGTDTFREPYGHHTVSRPRRCVFVGTVNDTEFLKDTTGNRRFWPVAVAQQQPVDRTGLKRDRDLLWAEAVCLFKAGARWWPEGPREVAMCATEQALYTERDVWDIQVREWVEGLSKADCDRGVSASEVLTRAVKLPLERQDRSAQMRVSKILSSLGATKSRRDDGARVYVVQRLSHTEADIWAD